MKRLNLLLLVTILLAACGPARSTSTPIALPRATSTYPPTWTPVRRGTPDPTMTPKPTATLAPIATPSASTIYTATDSAFTVSIPGNWSTQSGERQLISSKSQKMKYVAFGAPGAAPQPAVLIFYQWPTAGAITSDNAWEQAYAVASLAVKVCPINLTEGGSIKVGGEPGKYIGYEDSCGVQGELIGFIHNNVNYGILIEAPAAAWETWRPQLRDYIDSLAFLK